MYKFDCICGEPVTSATRSGACPRCARRFELEWPVVIETHPPDARNAEPALFARAAKLGT